MKDANIDKKSLNSALAIAVNERDIEKIEYLTKNIPDATAKNSEISSAYNMAEFGNAGVDFRQE